MANYKIDLSHSDINFKVKHLMISTVTGKFRKFDASMEATADDLSDATISFEAETATVNTGSEQRDGHLKSEEFFASEKYPKMSFVSSSFIKVSTDEYVIAGNLTIKDVTKPIELKVDFNGEMVDFYGQHKLGFELNGKINRKDFGLTWSAVTEAGGIVLGDDVKLNLNIQMIKQG